MKDAPSAEVPQVQAVTNQPPTEEKTIEQKEEDPKSTLLNALTPPPLPAAIANANQVQLEKAEKTLEQFGFSFPIKGLLESYISLHQTQMVTAQILVQLAEQTGKANQFYSKIEQAQIQQQQLLTERKKAEEELLRTHPELAQQMPQQTTPNLGVMGQYLPELLKVFTSQPQQTNGLNYAEIGQKFIQQALDNAMNPQQTALEKIGEMVIIQAVPKIATSIASKA